MVYTQVATLAVYLFMLASLFGRQYVKREGANVDLFVPVFPFLQVVFYLGWLKVGEVLTNPFGGDADDFEMNYVIDRNLRLSYTVVDEHCNTVPPIEKDAFWNVEPEVPHTVESAGLRTDPFIGSAASLDKPEQRSNAQTATGAESVSRSSSVRAAVRSGRHALTRPISRLLSRTPERDRAAEENLLLDLMEKGEPPSPSPTSNRRRQDANSRTSGTVRLPSIVERSEHAPDPVSRRREAATLISLDSDGSQAASCVTTPIAEEIKTLLSIVPSVRYSVAAEEDGAPRFRDESGRLPSSSEHGGTSSPETPASAAERPALEPERQFPRIGVRRMKKEEAIEDNGSEKRAPTKLRRQLGSLPNLSGDKQTGDWRLSLD